jgi:hypothetical protein
MSVFEWFPKTLKLKRPRLNWNLLRIIFFALENCCNKSSTPTWPVFGQHEIELVVYTHQLANPGLHDVFEVRMVPETIEVNHKVMCKLWSINVLPEKGPVNGDDDILVVHFLEQGGDAGGSHEWGSTADAFANEPIWKS